MVSDPVLEIFRALDEIFASLLWMTNSMTKRSRAVLHCSRMMRLVLALLSLATSARATPLGTAHKEVVTLDRSSFRQAIEDPANPRWLLKFYAPWCGHCKQLAPVLDEVAPETEGKLSIGKIDCTIEKGLCNEFGIKSFPTLKFSIDGDIYDYPGGRKKGDLLKFAEKVGRPAVQIVESEEQAYEMAEDGVAFLLKAPQGSPAEAVVTQLARKERASLHVLHLVVSSEAEEESASFCRIEAGIPTRCADNLTELTAVTRFAKRNHIPTVSLLGPHNFHTVGRSGRPLLVGVIDTKDEAMVAQVRSDFVRVSQSSEDYYYGYLDAKQWGRFLAQFGVVDTTPQLLVLNVPTKDYHQDASYGLQVDHFLSAVADGTIPQQKAGKQGLELIWNKLYYAIVENQPWSVVVVVVLCMSVGIIVLSIVSPSTLEADPRLKKPDSVVAASQELKAKVAAAAKEANESKKDK